MGQAIYISEDAFVAIFKPLPNPLDTYTSFDWGDGVGTFCRLAGQTTQLGVRSVDTLGEAICIAPHLKAFQNRSVRGSLVCPTRR